MQDPAREVGEADLAEIGRSLAFSPRGVDLEAATPQGFSKAAQRTEAGETPDTELGKNCLNPQFRAQLPGK